MKIAVAGKGGVGKTTVTALLAHHFAQAGRPVLAIDADPSPCLGPALGFPDAKLLELRPIAEMGELIAERTGTSAKSAAGFFRLNPNVADLPERFSVVHRGIRLLLLGAVQEGGSGCICPASALLKELCGTSCYSGTRSSFSTFTQGSSIWAGGRPRRWTRCWWWPNPPIAACGRSGKSPRSRRISASATFTWPAAGPRATPTGGFSRERRRHSAGGVPQCVGWSHDGGSLRKVLYDLLQGLADEIGRIARDGTNWPESV